MTEEAQATAEEHNAAGNACFKAGDYEAAFKCYSRALKRHFPRSSNPEVVAKYFTNRAASCINSENWDLACKDAEAAIELQPLSTKGHLYKGMALENRGMFEPALQSYERVLELDPTHSLARQAMMRCRASRTTSPSLDQATSDFMKTQQLRELQTLMPGTSGSLSPEQLQRMFMRSASPLAQTSGPMGKLLKAHMYRDGLQGKPKDPVKAATLYAKAGKAGIAEGMYMAGQMLLRGPAEVQDFVQGRCWLEKAAAQQPFLSPGVKNLGVLEAQHALGSLFRDGLGLPAPDIPKAVEWYKKTIATAGGYALAENDLGCLYEKGSVTGSPDAAAAAEWYRKAADHGYAIAQFNLAVMYLNGEGVTCDLSKAEDYLHKAAAQGFKPAECQLAVMDTDLGSGLKRLQKAAEAGEPQACYLLGRAHLKGEMGLSADAAQAKHWLRQAAKQNVAVAQFELGRLYWSSDGMDGCDHKPEKGFSFVEQAAQQQLGCAEYLLHVMYRTGNGTRLDLPRAKMWLQRAVDHGYDEGRAELQDWSNVASSRGGKAAKAAKEELQDASAAAGGSGGGGVQAHREELIKRLLDEVSKAATPELQEAMQRFLTVGGREHLTPVVSKGIKEGESYPLEALLRFADDASVTPLIRAKLNSYYAVDAAERNEAEEAVTRLAAAYAEAEYVVALSEPAMQMMERCCQALLRRNPNHVVARCCLMTLRVFAGQRGPAWAVQELDTILRIQPTNVDAWNYRGCMKAFLNRYAEASQDFTEAIRLDGGPDNCSCESLYMRGVATFNQRSGLISQDSVSRASALADFGAFLRRVPPRHRKVPNACYFMAMVQLRSQDRAEGLTGASKAWYFKGLQAERSRLPIHPPVDSPQKDSLRLLDLVSSRQHIPKAGAAEGRPGRQLQGDDQGGSGGGSGAGSRGGEGGLGAGGGLCAGCGKASVFGLKLKTCARCKQVSYCSKECQHAHWKQHKATCKAP